MGDTRPPSVRRNAVLSRTTVFLLAPLFLAGLNVTSFRQKPTYELSVEAMPTSGFSEDPARTRYVLSRTDFRPPRELWSLTRTERYVRHWISPEGRVWVATQSSRNRFVRPEPPAFSAVWTRDASGEKGGTWSNWSPSSVRTAPPGPFELNRARIVPLRRQGFSEQFRIPRQDGGELRFTLVAREDGNPIMLSRDLASGEKDLLTETMEEGGYNDLRLTRPVSRSPIALWEGQAPNGGRRRILQDVDDWSFLGDPGRPLPIRNERLVALAPASVVRTPGGRVLWFGFSSVGEADAARLTITRLDGAPLADVDLVALGGYESSVEARTRLRFQNLKVDVGGTWEPIEGAGERGAGSLEKIELRDDRSRFMIVIDAHGASVKRAEEQR